MKIPSTIATILLLGATTLFFAGCNSGGVGIFYSLQNETKVLNNSNLPSTLTVDTMAEMSFGATSTYFIGSGKIYEATVDTALGATLTWKAVKAPDTTHVFCNQVAVNGTTLYAVYSTTDGTSSLLYQASLSSLNVETPSWSLVVGYTGNPATPPTDYTIQSIFEVHTQLFVSVLYSSGANAGLYGLFVGGDASANSVLLDVSSNPYYSPSPAAGVAFDGASYWVAVGNKLFSGSGPTGLTEVTGTGAPSLSQPSETYRDVYWSPTLSALFVSTSTGELFAKSSGSPTFGTTSATWPTGITAGGLDGFGEITSGGKTVVVVGSDAGYYELDLTSGFDVNAMALAQPGNTTLLSADVNYLTIALKSAHVIGFFGDTSRLFALTGGAGLWRNEANAAGTSRSWAID